METKSKPNRPLRNSNEGQGFNDARGDIPDTGKVPKYNGLNVNNDPEHIREKEKSGKQNNPVKSRKPEQDWGDDEVKR